MSIKITEQKITERTDNIKFRVKSYKLDDEKHAPHAYMH